MGVATGDLYGTIAELTPSPTAGAGLPFVVTAKDWLPPSALTFSSTWLLIPPLIKSGGLRPIPAHGHAAPPPAVILRHVIEVQDALRRLALSEIGRIAIAEEVGGGFGNRRKQPSGFAKVGMEAFLEAALGPHDF